MKDVAGKVAFITGAAHGIGLGMAKAFHKAGMKVVMADIRKEALDAARKALPGNAEVHTLQLDVADRDGWVRAADEAEKIFGKVHLLCNNAGINVFGPLDEATYADWDWVINVNLYGVINGLVTFIPRIKKHGEGGHIVNTASMASICSGPGAGIYTTTKFAVRGLSECLWYHLAPQGIGVSVLCPGLVKSHIFASEEIRPREFAESGYPKNEEFTKRLEEVHTLGMDPVEVGEKVLRAVQRDDLYIFPHPDHRDEVRQLFDEILKYFPDETPEPRRMAFENGRRKIAADIREKVQSMRK